MPSASRDKGGTGQSGGIDGNLGGYHELFQRSPSLGCFPKERRRGGCGGSGGKVRERITKEGKGKRRAPNGGFPPGNGFLRRKTGDD